MSLQPSAVKLREYDQIFTGSNEQEGYEQPFLEFTADTVTQILYADYVTYFHYPKTAPVVPLSSSGLVQDGAVPGEIPHNADKIWKKMANYSRYIHWGDSSIQPGIWLCSWLSGNLVNIDQPPVWKDRWYNPGYIDPDDALSFPGYHEYSPSAVIVDVDSQMLFEPGVWYKYFHVGNEFNQALVNSLTGSVSALRVHIDDWAQTTVDLSPFDNLIVLVNYSAGMTSPMSVNPANGRTDTCLVLNGDDQHVQVVYDTSFDLRDRMSCSFWAYAEEWEHIEGYSILNRGFRGGWDIRYNNGFYTPMVVFFGSGGDIGFANTEGHVYYTKTLPGESRPISLKIDNDLYTWVIDNGLWEGLKHLYKIDHLGDIVSQVQFSSSVELTAVAMDSQKNIYVLDSHPALSSYVSAFDSFTNLLSTFAFEGDIHNIVIDLNDVVIPVSSVDMCIDSQNRRWDLQSGQIRRDGLAVFQLSGTNIVCDRDDNIWVLFGDSNFVKFNSSVSMQTSGSVGSPPGPGIRGLSFTQERHGNIAEDFAWFTHDTEFRIYKRTMNGVPVESVDLRPFVIRPRLRETTSYDWNRKFNYIPIGSAPRIELNVTTGTLFVPDSGLFTMSFPASALSDRDWHLFSFTYDGAAGQIVFYVDAILRGVATIPVGAKIFHTYQNSIFIGADASNIRSLDEDLQLDQLHFRGRLDDVRVYNCILDEFDFFRIYMLKYDYENMSWNIPTGNQSYVEEIERFFKFKLPGSKSQYYNIRLVGLHITEPSVRVLIEDIVRDTVKKLAPAHAELFRVIWD